MLRKGLARLFLRSGVSKHFFLYKEAQLFIIQNWSANFLKAISCASVATYTQLKTKKNKAARIGVEWGPRRPKTDTMFKCQGG